MKFSTLSNVNARKDSHAPDTVAAWDDHFIVQFKRPEETRYSIGHPACSVKEANQKAAAISKGSGLVVRIVYPGEGYLARMREEAAAARAAKRSAPRTKLRGA